MRYQVGNPWEPSPGPRVSTPQPLGTSPAPCPCPPVPERREARHPPQKKRLKKTKKAKKKSPPRNVRIWIGNGKERCPLPVGSRYLCHRCPVQVYVCSKCAGNEGSFRKTDEVSNRSSAANRAGQGQLPDQAPGVNRCNKATTSSKASQKWIS